MDLIWSRWLRSAYRREPVTSFVITACLVAAAIGGFDAQWSLVSLGMGMAGIAIGLRWWQQQRRSPSFASDRPPVYALPPRSSRPILPTLSVPQKRSRGNR